MSSYVDPPSPSPSSWAIDPYLRPQPELIHRHRQRERERVDVEETYPALPSPPSDGTSSPRTPPQPALPIPKSPNRSSRKHSARSDTPPPPTKSAAPANGPSADQLWAQPTISTFSASSSSFNHIHIVQPYLQSGSTGPTDLFSSAGIHFVGMGGPSSDGRPPRPANAWILYRSAKMKVLKEPQSSGQPRRTQADISKLIAEMWKNETPEVRQYYEAMSDMKKAEHLAQYPTYRFQPMKRADKEKARLEKKAQKERERAEAALTRSRGPRSRSRSRRRQATGATADDAQLDGQIAGFPPGTQVLAWGTTPSTPHSAAFQPYSKPPKRSSSATRKPHTPPEQSSPPPVEKSGAKPPLAPLNTAFVPPSTVSPSVLSGVAVASLATPDHLQFAPDWSQTPYSAHPDYSFSSVAPLMTTFGESTLSGWHPHIDAYAPPASACSTSAPSLPQTQRSSEFLTLFTDPGTAFTAPMPSGFDFPELGQLADLDQLFGPAGFDPAAFESMTEPLSSTAASQSHHTHHHHHHQQPVMTAPAPAPLAPQSFYEPPPLSAGLEIPVQYQEFAPQSETSVEVVTSAEAAPTYGLDTTPYFTVAPPAYTPSAPVVYAHAQPPRKQSVASPPDIFSYGVHYDLSSAYQQTPWSVPS